jgi:glycosyltransferase involved in cell wall biosynthesis
MADIENVKILAVSNFGGFVGGGEYSFCELLENLALSMETVAVVPGPGEVGKRLNKAGIEVIDAPLSAIRPWTIPRAAADLVRAFSISRTVKPSLIYANGSRAAVYFGLVGRRLKIPVVWHCRVADKDPLLDPILVRTSDLIVSNSKATASRFSIFNRCRVEIVYNGVDIKRFQGIKAAAEIENPLPERRILHVARLSPEKRQDVAIEAFDMVADEFPDLGLYFIGGAGENDTGWWAALQAKAQRSPHSKRIHWVGGVDDAAEWVCGGSVLILPSDKEGFGRVIVEAMACGVPVVASRVGGVTEIVTHGLNGFLVSPGCPGDMAASIRRLLADVTLSKRIAAEGLKRAADFDMSNHVENMKKIFSGVAHDETVS